jgi:hypothetical protein
VAKVEEKIQHEIDEVAEGRDEFTPFKALFGLWLVIAVVAGFLIVVGVLIWVLLS